MQKMLIGMQNAASNGFKDIYKACKNCLVDKAMSVRWAAAKVCPNYSHFKYILKVS